MRFLPLVLKNLFRKKTRTLLTIASILFPLLVIAFLGTFLKALRFADPARKGYFRVVTRHKVGLTTPIPVAWARRIEPLPGVVAVTVLSPFRGIYRDESAGNVFPRFAADAATFFSGLRRRRPRRRERGGVAEGPRLGARRRAAHAEVRLEARGSRRDPRDALPGRPRSRDRRRLPPPLRDLGLHLLPP